MVRIKHRYLLVNILYPERELSTTSKQSSQSQDQLPWTVQFRRPTSDEFNAKTLINLVRRGVEDLFGDYGLGMIASSLVVKYFSPATSTAIIRVARAHYRLVWAALSFTTALPHGEACVFQIVRVSGTIRKSEEEAIRRARSMILRAKDPTQAFSASNKTVAGPLPPFYAFESASGIEDPDESVDDDDADNDDG